MQLPQIQIEEFQKLLPELIQIPSPSGRTSAIEEFIMQWSGSLGLEVRQTRKGALRIVVPGLCAREPVSIAAHLDTLGAMVKSLKSNGRLEVVMIGHWSARSAEGARVTVYTDEHRYRGTVVPLKASGHTYNQELDSQPCSWSQVEIRLDEKVHSRADLQHLGFHPGDFVAVDPSFEWTDAGFICSRHLDDKAGVTSLLLAVKSLVQAGLKPPREIHILLSVMEEEGTGASAVLDPASPSLLAVDNSTVAEIQNSSEYGVTVAMRDSSGVYDRDHTRHILDLCRRHNIEHSRDVFRYYRSDASAALVAGADVRAALICFALDASHGHERTHIDSLLQLGRLLQIYMLDPFQDQG